jgi:uncharacterized repeat protein (TIGR01451 family)
VTSTLTAEGLPTQILDLDVRLSIDHNFSDDLDVTLVSPAGTEITLTTDNGAGNDDVFRGTRFDDQATEPVTDHLYANGVAVPALSPEEPLAALDGENPNGVWQLRVQDDAPVIAGTLESWSIVVTAQGGTAGPITTSTQGSFASVGTPIPDNNPAGVTIGLAFASSPDPVWAYEVELDVTHTFSGDLDMTLSSPTGTVAVLSTDNGGPNGGEFNDVFHGTLFTRKAGVTNPPGPVSDVTYANGVPETPVAAEQGGAFRGENPGGTWTLKVADDAAAETGSLHSYKLRLFTANCHAADLSAAVTASPDRVTAGGNGIYVATVGNDGPGTAADVAFQGTLPDGATLIRATPSQGSCTGAACSLGSIQPGDVAQVVMVARLDRTGDATATAAVTSPTTETAPSNNSGSATIGVDPAAAALDAPPVLVLAVGSPPKLRAALRRGVTVVVGCTEASRIAAVGRVHGKTVAKGKTRLRRAGAGRLKLRFTRAAKKKLANARSVRLVLAGVATDSIGQKGKSRVKLLLTR